MDSTTRAPRSRPRDPNVFLDEDLDDLRLELFPGMRDRVTGVVIAPPADPPRWASRAGPDRGHRYRVGAYLQFAEHSILEDANVIVRPDGRWEVRSGKFDGWPIDIRRLVDQHHRLEAGEVIHELAKPVLRKLNGHG